MRTPLLGMDLSQLSELLAAGGFPAFRAKQVYQWLYRHAALSFEEMKNLPKDVRLWLSEHCEIGHSEIAEIRGSAEDGSQKLLFRLRDGKIVESVLMQDRDWQTLCVSSQVGCAVACTFCMTGFGGFRRHMTCGEILSQFLLAKRMVNKGVSPRNIVFMGMGEPMLNLDQVIPALRLLIDSDGMDVSPRRITVSTSGILPGIERLGQADTGVNIAISLNASNDEFRNQIMPINKAYPTASLLEACRAFPLKSRRRITFEYVLLGGLNDKRENAKELAALLRGLPCKINLIPWNPDSHLPYQRPSEESVRRFQQYLLDQHFTVSVRYSKGMDIGAACGQLAGHWEDELKAAMVPAQ
ncbi:MAG: 23S rRNA (adenine(2503)-C(2))-methyltransferase RlmN [Candidatus Sumerlaeaceae bacterium]